MTWRRHVTMVRAVLALWVVSVATAVSNAWVWLQHHLGARPRVPPGVRPLVDPSPDDVTIDLTERDHASV